MSDKNKTPGSVRPSKGMSRELALRFASAAILIPIGLISIWNGGWILAAFAAFAAGAIGFEYLRMIGQKTNWPVILIGVAACLAFPVSRIIAVSLLFVGGAAIAWLAVRKPMKFTVFFGILYSGGMALGVIALRGHPELGWAMAMAVMLCTWASDTSAYFVGRAIGGPKLAPKDSPNKTWSGAIGAVIGAALSGWAFGALIDARWLALWALTGALISVSAQVGDLFESQIKRRYGVKDASGILPGHGGVMDRVDGFGTAALIAICCLAIPGVAEWLGSKAT